MADTPVCVGLQIFTCIVCAKKYKDEYIIKYKKQLCVFM